MNGQSFLDQSLFRTPPTADEIEITIFGRGFGECIVLCCKNQKFIVIDSFINSSTSNPIAIDYLNSLNLPISSIKEVVLTHWHQDHISGISDILNEASKEAKLVISPIIREQKFNQYISRGFAENNPSTKEFRKVYDFIRDRNGKNVIFATVDRRIYSNEHEGEAEVYSLSPSDKDLFRFLDKIFLPSSQQATSYCFPSDNLLSIVLLLKYDRDGFLLGSDMESTNSKEDGWGKIVNEYTHSKTKSSVFKVPHHGSITGHLDEIWTTLLQEKPISATTVYNKNGKLPTEEDIERIKALSSKFFVVGNKGKKDKDISLKIKKVMPNTKISTIPQDIGVFRYRKNTVDGSEKIETFGCVQEYISDKALAFV